MLFSSIIFVFYFFPITLLVYYLLSFSRTAQNIWLLIVSLVFYAWGGNKYIILLTASILANTVFGILVDRYRENKKISRRIMIGMCTVNLGILFVFKYLMFVVKNINTVLGTNFSVGNIVLPLGISFFTFQAVSYVVDVYRGNAKVEKNPLYVGLYIAFFPQLIAGPIVRYSTIASQIRNRRSTIDKFSVGCCRFLTGLGKKIIISNNMAVVADYIYDITEISQVSVALAWIGSIAYTLQIFFDFSAYSDMAIGLGLIFGFELDENFNYPYISKSVSEFWRRWHISLTTWFKDYIYFPLGGSRVENMDKMVRNIFIVWLFTGIWHGAEWTFILWGLLNFAAIMIERFFGVDKMRTHVTLRRIGTLVLINFGWVLFRAENLSKAGQYLKNMLWLSGNKLYSPEASMFLKEYWIFFLLGILFSTPIARRFNKLQVDRKFGAAGPVINFCYPFVILTVFLVCVTYMVKGSYNPFIYFNF